MSEINEVEKLCFPVKVLDQHLVMLGKTGAGKSSALRHIVEHLLSKGKRVCIVDPKGDWWGLKASADGKSAGFPVIMFGDFKESKAQDVPINDRSGQHIAELVTGGNRPCVIGLRGWTQSSMIRFWIDFASTLFSKNAGELYIVGDEFHNFAPKGKILSPQVGESIHWSNRLLSEGRGLGMVCLLASQRPQKVHNDTLTSCETLVAMRVIHKADRDAVKDWIDGNGDPAIGKEVLGSLAGMPRGEAWIWSPEIGYGPERIKFPMFTTFDSFAPPQLQKKVNNASWADVNLDQVKQKLATVIEEAKANDPKELQKQIVAMKSEIAALKKQSPAVSATQVKTVDKPVITEKQIDRLERMHLGLQNRADKTWERFTDMINPIQELLKKEAAEVGQLLSTARAFVPGAVATRPSASTAVRVAPAAVVRPTQPRAQSNGDATVGTGGLRRILIALAQRPGLTNRQIGVRAGLSSSSGSFGTYLSTARKNGWIRDESERRYITDEGVSALGEYQPLPTGDALMQHWLDELGGGASRILQSLANAYPNVMDNESIGAAAGISHTSGSFGTYMSKLRSLELIQGGRGATKASVELFD